MKGPPCGELHQRDLAGGIQWWLAGQQRVVRVASPAAASVRVEVCQCLLDPVHTDGDAGQRGQPPQNRQRGGIRLVEHQQVGELRLAHDDLGDGPAIVEFVGTDRLVQPLVGVNCCDHCVDADVTSGRAVDIAGSDVNRHLVDRHAEGFGFRPRCQEHDDARHVVATVQPAQQDQQVVAGRAADAAIGQLQRPFTGRQLTVAHHADPAPHHLPVVFVPDDRRTRGAHQCARHSVAVTLAGDEDYWCTHFPPSNGNHFHLVVGYGTVH